MTTWRELIASCRVPGPMMLSLQLVGGDSLRLELPTISVVDWSPTTVVRVVALPRLTSVADGREWLRDQVMSLVAHKVNELMHFVTGYSGIESDSKGCRIRDEIVIERPFDPHRGRA